MNNEQQYWDCLSVEGEAGGVRVVGLALADLPPPPPFPGRRYAIDDFICCFSLFLLCLVSPM